MCGAAIPPSLVCAPTLYLVIYLVTVPAGRCWSMACRVIVVLSLYRQLRLCLSLLCFLVFSAVLSPFRGGGVVWSPSLGMFAFSSWCCMVLSVHLCVWGGGLHALAVFQGRSNLGQNAILLARSYPLSCRRGLCIPVAENACCTFLQFASQ